MKNLFLLLLFLFSFALNAQTNPPFGCTNTDPCNLICNGGILDIASTFPPSGDPPGCLNEMHGNQGNANAIKGWFVTGGSPGYMNPTCTPSTWLPYTPLSASNGQFFLYELGSNTESIMSGANTVNNKHYLFSYFRMSARVTSNDHHTKIEIGDVVDVLNHPNPPQGFLTSSPVFESSQIILQEAFSNTDWEQTVTCFQSTSDNDVLNIRSESFGAQFGGLYFDQVELIEDELITNSANIQTLYNIICQEDISIGADLCEITSLEYQFWDVTDLNPGNHFQLDATTITASYSVGSLNGAQLDLNNVNADVDLELRRVFINPDGYPVNSNNCGVILPIEINVNSAGAPTDATFTITPPNTPIQDCYNYQFHANTAYDFHEWDFVGDSTPEISGPGSDLGILNPSFTFPGDGTYTVTHTVSTDCGSLLSQQVIIIDCIDHELTVTKEAYSLSNSNAPISTVYVNGFFEWRVTIENNLQNYEMNWEDIFPDSSNVDCPFTINSIVVELNGVDTGDIIDPNNLNGTLVLGVGTTEIRFNVRPCADSSYSGTLFENCFRYEDPNSLTEPPEYIEVCDEVLLAYGCPAALSDGFCLDQTDLQAGDIIASDIDFHISFSGIVKMEGDLVFDPNIFDPTIFNSDFFELNPIIANSTTEAYIYGDPGIVHFTFTTNPAFTIGSAGTFNPFSVTLELLNDLNECTTILINNFELTEDTGDVFPVYVDPGEFCYVYGPGYESAWIVTPPGDTCADGSLELTVLGPFETQHPSTTYLWSPGGQTTQSINVTQNGSYTVLVNDSDGCERSAMFEVEDCGGVQCVCEEINPQIIWSVEGCSVVAQANLPACNNIAEIAYHWEFSNGNVYNGEFPPPQTFAGPNGGYNSISLGISYKLSDYPNKCFEEVIENIFVPCRGNDKSDSKMKLHPNPAKDRITISINDIEKNIGKIEITNVYGRVVHDSFKNSSSVHNEFEFNVSNLAIGIYFVKYSDESGFVEVARLVVE